MTASPAKTIVITGCSTGFGRVTALHLARRGWRVFATVRKEADHASLLVEAMAHGAAARLMPVLCDITRADQVQALAQTVSDAASGLDGLLCNAGTSFPMPLELLPLDDLRAQLEVNLIGQLAVTQALLPRLKSARGTLMLVSSISGRTAFPANGAYHMSKWALEAMGDVLRLELAPLGVKVVVIQPGSSPTAIWQTSIERGRAGLAGRNLGAYAPLVAAVEREALASAGAGFPPEMFAATVAKILDLPRPRTRYPIPRRAGGVINFRRFAPDWLWDWVVRRSLKW